MTDSKLRPIANIKAKVGTYTDRDGKEKGRWVDVGTLFSSPHGSNMTIKLDSVPVSPDWKGWLSVFKIEEPDDTGEASGDDVDL